MAISTKFPLACTILVSFASLVGCGGSDVEPNQNPPVDELLAPPAAGEGVQFKMVTELAAGSEVEHCMFVRGPAEGMFVNHDEVRYSKGSHHVLVYETQYTEIPTQKKRWNRSRYERRIRLQ